MQVVRRVSLFFQLTIGAIISAGTAIIGIQFAPSSGAWLGVIPLLVTVFAAVRTPLRRWRACREPFPDHWHAWLAEHVPYYKSLPPACRRRFEQDVQIFLTEQTIEGVAGVIVTEEYRLAIAASAAVLLNGRPAWEIPRNHSFLLYPGHFNEEYLLVDDRTDTYLLGRAHGQGPIILALPAVEQAIRHPTDGQNVILHELTHLLDFANLPAAGAAGSQNGLSPDELEALLDREMRRIDRGASLLGSYAGTNPAEFLAVATERFFERAETFERKHPQLYELMCAVYNQDPLRPGHRIP